MPDFLFVGLGWVFLVVALIMFPLGFSNALKARRRGDADGSRQILRGLFWGLFPLAGYVVWIRSRGHAFGLGLCLLNVPTLVEWTGRGLRSLRRRLAGRTDSPSR